MMERLVTTPFGGARVTARDIARQKWIAEKQAAMANGADRHDGKADKWHLLRALTEAKEHYALSDRSISVLEALLSFHQSRELNGDAPVIVFPSNAELSLRSRGMSPATIRRHVAVLVKAGLIMRRDSPNGKRYCRRNRNGVPVEKFGFDLAPLALMARDIYARAEQMRAEQEACQQLRGEITVNLRDVTKIIDAAVEEQRPGAWLEFQSRISALSSGLPRKADRHSLETRFSDIIRLRAEVENAYLDTLSDPEMSANESENEHHIQNSKTEITYESQGDKKPGVDADALAQRVSTPKSAGSDQIAPTEITLKRVLNACPQIADYGKSGIETWPQLIAAASLVRLLLGISPPAWQKACETMGSSVAAIVIAAILQRTESIRCAGAYLNTLTDRAAQGRFSVIAMLKALEHSQSASLPR